MTQGVLIFAETIGAALAPIAREMCGVGRRLADALGEPLLAAVVGSGVGDAARDAIAHGADRVYVADAKVLETYQTASYCAVLGQIAEQAGPEVLLVGMSDNGRDLGPRLAFRLRTGLASDCVDLAVDPGTRLLEATRPVSGGNAMATVVMRSRDRRWPPCAPRPCRQPSPRTAGRVRSSPLTCPWTPPRCR